MNPSMLVNHELSAPSYDVVSTDPFLALLVQSERNMPQSQPKQRSTRIQQNNNPWQRMNISIKWIVLRSHSTKILCSSKSNTWRHGRCLFVMCTTRSTSAATTVSYCFHWRRYQSEKMTTSATLSLGLNYTSMIVGHFPHAAQKSFHRVPLLRRGIEAESSAIQHTLRTSAHGTIPTCARANKSFTCGKRSASHPLLWFSLQSHTKNSLRR